MPYPFCQNVIPLETLALDVVAYFLIDWIEAAPCFSSFESTRVSSKDAVRTLAFIIKRHVSHIYSQGVEYISMGKNGTYPNMLFTRTVSLRFLYPLYVTAT